MTSEEKEKIFTVAAPACYSAKQTYPPCHGAVLRGDMGALEPLLSGHIPIDSRDADGNTPLALAAFCDHRALLQSLLAKGAHVNAKDCKRQTPLHKASRQGHAGAVTLLLEHKADVNRQKCREETPLMLACARGHADVAKVLLEAGADITSRDMYDRLPLHWAIKGGNLEIVKMLHDRGSKFTSCDKFRKNAVLQATKCNHPDMLEFILQRCPEGVRQQDSLMRGPLQIAAVKNSIDCIAPLIRHGVSVNHQANQSRTALMNTAFCGNLESLQVLLSYPDCDVDLTDQHGSTALILAVMGQKATAHLNRNKPWMDVIFSLVNANADLSVQTRSTMFWDRASVNQHNQNALELALKAGQSECVKLLARAGSDVGNLGVYFKLPTKQIPSQILKHQRLLDWLRRWYKSPRPLTELSRHTFRRHYGKRWRTVLPLLHVAPAIEQYLNFADLCDLLTAPHHVTPEMTSREDGDRSEVEYEPSAYDSDWYGKLDHIVDTESEGEEDSKPPNDTARSVMAGNAWCS